MRWPWRQVRTATPALSSWSKHHIWCDVETRLQLRTEVRSLLDEPTAKFWSDAEINKGLYRAASLVSRLTQNLRYPFQIAAVESTPEYALPFPLHDIISVSYFNGTHQSPPLHRRDARDMIYPTQQRSSMPMSYYLKPYVNLSAFQGVLNNLKIARVGRTPNAYQTILGVSPVPNQSYDPSTGAGVLTVEAYVPHPKLNKDTDLIHIPDGFEDAVVWHTAGKLLLKEKFFDEAQSFLGLFKDYMESMQAAAAVDGQIDFPRVKDAMDEDDHYLDPSKHYIVVD